MFMPFTDRARKVMALANQEAQRFNHKYICTEHILLGLLKEGKGPGAAVLKQLGLEVKKLRKEVEKLVKSGPDVMTTGKLPQTPRAKRVVERAVEEARAQQHEYVSTAHLLLGLLRDEGGVAAQVLVNLGLKLEDIRQEVLNLLGAGTDESNGSAYVAAPQEKPTNGDVKTLALWQKADELASQVYTVTGRFPKREAGDIISLLRRAALSIPPHVAEAHGRRDRQEARWFLNSALGALAEMQYLFDFFARQGYLKARARRTLETLAEEVGDRLRALHASLMLQPPDTSKNTRFEVPLSAATGLDLRQTRALQF